MRRRLYFILPDLQSARSTVNELLLEHIDIHHIHLMAGEGRPMKGLPEANLLQTSDVIHALGSGIAIGGLLGLGAGLLAAFYPGFALEPAGLVILIPSLIGAFVGAWSGSMIAVDVPNSHLKKFDKQLEHGNYLLMVDVPKDQVQNISEKLKQHHPEASRAGMEPSIPAFP